MKPPRKNHSSRPADPRAGRRAPKTQLAAPDWGGSREAVIHVRCPNPACRKSYTIRSSLAGKNGRCPCGAVFAIPRAGAPRAARPTTLAPSQPRQAPRRAAGAGLLREEAAAREREDVTEVHAGCIGRGQAGKTALLRTLSEALAGDFFPSGLHADAGDPREVARMIREAEEAERLLHTTGLPPTRQASRVRYYLYDGAARRVVYKLREVIGQVLTHTLPDSAADQQARYAKYVRNLVNTNVLWVVIPCPPPNPGARDRRRYANDLRITLAYLREALRLRTLEGPVAVALVLSKIDVLFKDAEEARASLTDEVLRTSFGPLVHLIEQSPRVSDAVAIPVTAFGFGNAVLLEEGARPGPGDEPFGAEPVWLLREGVSAEPYNLDTLFLWTLLFGLLNQAGHGVLDEDTDLGRICRTLCEDLNAVDPWLLPLTGGIAGEARQAPETPSRRGPRAT
jgi:hypothetical protein